MSQSLVEIVEIHKAFGLSMARQGVRRKAAAGALAASLAVPGAGAAAMKATPTVGHAVDAARFAGNAGNEATRIAAVRTGSPLVSIGSTDDWVKLGRPGTEFGAAAKTPQYMKGSNTGVTVTNQFGNRQTLPATPVGRNALKVGNPATGLSYDLGGQWLSPVRPGAAGV